MKKEYSIIDEDGVGIYEPDSIIDVEGNEGLEDAYGKLPEVVSLYLHEAARRPLLKPQAERELFILKENGESLEKDKGKFGDYKYNSRAGT